MGRMVRLRAPDEQIGSTIQMSGWSGTVPPDGIVSVPQSCVGSLIDIGYWPEGSAASVPSPSQDGSYDPGDLTVLFDNQLI